MSESPNLEGPTDWAALISAPKYEEDVELGSIKFDALTPTEFENVCLDLVKAAGYSNVDWRKGTPLDASPADRGRDLVAQLKREDVDGYSFDETWFIDCKHYKKGVPPEALRGTITWAEAERPSTVLFIASGFLSNGAKDWLSHVEARKPGFRIRVWELPQLRDIVAKHLDIAFRHNLPFSALRRVSDIVQAEASLTDALWYGRKPLEGQAARENIKPDVLELMREGMRSVEEKYGIEELKRHTESDFSWGLLSGKVSAIRWVLGEQWDALDS